MSLTRFPRLRCICLMIALSLSACSHSVHQLYVGTMDRTASYDRGRWVQAEASDFVVLAFAFDSNYVDTAVAKLEKQCPGRITQVITEHLTSYKFLSYDQKILLKGWCRV